MVKTTAKNKPKPDTARVYSYLRYSTKEQALGDSERRQLEMTKTFAERTGLILDEALRMFDKGISAFRGKHRRKGALAGFLSDVEAGRVPSGSYLVLENLDRLSREGFGAALRQIIYRLWDFGIILQTLSPEESYPPGCENDPKFIGLWLYLNRAHDESVRKSERLYSAWKGNRERVRQGKGIMTRQCPQWLIVKDGKFGVIPEAAKAIKEAFKMKLTGVSVRIIARKLNGPGWWNPRPRKGQRTTGWRPSYIAKILTNQATIGLYQPFIKKWEDGVCARLPAGEPIADYYPRIIEDHLFYAVQNQLAGNRRTGGPVYRNVNLFRGFIRCGYCQGPVHLVSCATTAGQRQYLVCDAGRRGLGCKRRSMRYDEVEKLVLENAKGLRPQDVLPDPGEQSELCQALRQRLAGYAAQEAEMSRQIDNVMANLANTQRPTMVKRYEKQIADLEAQQARLREEAKQIKQQLDAAEVGLQSFEQWQVDLASLQKALSEQDNEELRMRLRSHLAGLIETVLVYSEGFAEQYVGQGDDEDARLTKLLRNHRKWAALTPEQRREIRKPRHRDQYETIGDVLSDEMDKPDSGFIRWVVQQRMSKRGRFVRVLFKTGVWRDLRPEKSIASGSKLILDKDQKPQWETVHPSWRELWKEYRKSKK